MPLQRDLKRPGGVLHGPKSKVRCHCGRCGSATFRYQSNHTRRHHCWPGWVCYRFLPNDGQISNSWGLVSYWHIFLKTNDGIAFRLRASRIFIFYSHTSSDIVRGSVSVNPVKNMIFMCIHSSIRCWFPKFSSDMRSLYLWDANPTPLLSN